MKLLKKSMLKSLPVRKGELTIRPWTREDTYERANWPSYPPPYVDFNFALMGASKEQLDRHFIVRHNDPNRLALAIDYGTQPVIGYLALHDIDWSAQRVGNLGLRIHPEWCDKGIGTSVIRMVARWCSECGMRALRLDVGPANPRALRCYQKAGFVKVGEFWRDEPKLKDVDIQQKRYDLVRPHSRVKNGTPQVRFWWVELDCKRLNKGG